jgi:hypothetical protein
MTEISLSHIPERYPSLGRIWLPYIGRLAEQDAEVAAQSWLWKATHVSALGLSDAHEQYLTEWNEVACLLDGASAESLAEKFLRTLPATVSNWRGAYDDALLDVMAELLAFGWMKVHKGCKDVAFVKEAETRQPDLLGDGRMVVECKHFRTSDRDRDYFANHQFEARSVALGGPDRLLAKILSTFQNDVLPKFDEYPVESFERYLFADISPDAELWGPIEHEFPGTMQGIVEAASTRLAIHDVKVAAIQLHRLDLALTPTESLAGVESRQ